MPGYAPAIASSAGDGSGCIDTIGMKRNPEPCTPSGLVSAAGATWFGSTATMRPARERDTGTRYADCGVSAAINRSERIAGCGIRAEERGQRGDDEELRPQK